MKRDLRNDPLYRDTQQFFSSVYAGSFGHLVEVWDVRASLDGTRIAVEGRSYDDLNGPWRTRIALYDPAHGTLSMLETQRNDTMPRWSPAGDRLAFLSDRALPDRYAAYIYDRKDERVRALAAVAGTAESLDWSPDGTRLFVQTAGGPHSDLPEWMPQVEQSIPEDAWRRLWICAPDGSAATPIDWLEVTVWEAAWCGNDALIAVVSDNPREAAWFEARFVYVDLQRKTCETIHVPAYQIGLPAATPDGRYAGIVEGCCSDRGFVAGEALLFDRMLAWHATRIDVANADVTFLCARDAARFSFAGVRDPGVIAGDISVENGAAEITTASSGSWLRIYPGVAPVGKRDFITVAQTYAEPPSLVRYDGATGKATVLHRFAYEGSAYAIENAGRLERRMWYAPDGLEIHGYLAHPTSEGPYPLVVFLHGGPVTTYTNTWCMYNRMLPALVKSGYAVLLPNPRGSSGRGQTFVRLICGDLGGAEVGDVLSGVNALVNRGLVDPARMAVMGESHGGYLAAIIISQTDLFAAAVCGFPVTDIFSGNFTATPSEAMPPFIRDSAFDPGGQFFTRSPLMHAAKVRTPVLVVAGARDTVIGVTQGLEFHRALAQMGAESELVTYPLEGHGLRRIGANIDYCTRILHWLKTHIPSGARSRTS